MDLDGFLSALAISPDLLEDSTCPVEMSIRNDYMDKGHIIIYNKITNVSSSSSLLTWIDCNLDYSFNANIETSHLITYFTRSCLFEQWGKTRARKDTHNYHVINGGFIKSIPPKGTFTYIVIAEKLKLDEIVLKYKKCIHYVNFDIVSKYLYNIDYDEHLCYPIDYIVIHE